MADLTILFDGGCLLCLREVKTLKRLDNGAGHLAFIDIDQPDYDPELHQGISYRDAMGRIHAIAADGEVVTDVAVFRRAYSLVGWGWLYAPTRWPVIGSLADVLYRWWAS
ncbi:MAG: thiol-disulfide oxidoreductase, partial [Synechococcus sp. TMED169]